MTCQTTVGHFVSSLEREKRAEELREKQMRMRKISNQVQNTE